MTRITQCPFWGFGSSARACALELLTKVGATDLQPSVKKLK